MSKPLTGSAKKVQNFLIDNGFSCTVKELPDSTRTAEEAAKAIGCEVAQIAKSLIFIDKISSYFTPSSLAFRLAVFTILLGSVPSPLHMWTLMRKFLASSQR